MKKINILQFFSKKGVLVLGLIAGMVLALFCSQLVLASAEEDNTTDDYILICDYTRPGLYHTGLYVRNDIYSAKQVAILKNGDSYISRCSEALGTSNSYRFNETNIGTGSNAGKVREWYLSGIGSSFSTTSDTIAFFVPVFDSQEKVDDYFATGDYSNALNCDDLQDFEQSKEQVTGIDDSLPYFDSSVMQLNQNDSVTYRSAMSSAMQSEFYQMCAKTIDKNGTAESTERYKAYVELSASAIYANESALGYFNSMALKLAGSTVPGGKDKLDDVIQFDSNGRLKVASYSNADEMVAKEISGSSNPHRMMVAGMFDINHDSDLVAVSVDDVTLGDKNSSFPGVTRNLSAASRVSGASLLADCLFGSLVSEASYDLVGYVADVRIVYYEVDTGKYIASRDTYTYTWIYSTLQERYGSGTVSYDSDGNIVTKNDFDNLNSDIGSNWGSVPDYEPDTLLQYIRKGFGLLGTDGYIELSRRYFLGIPVYIWALIAMAMSVNIIVIVFKVARGM